METDGVGRGTEGDRVGEERGERERKIEGVGRGTEGDRGGGERDRGR